MNIWGKMMVSAGGAVLAAMLVGSVGLFGMERINGAIETQAAVGSLLKQHMAAVLGRAKLVNDVERAIRVGRMNRDEGPAMVEGAKAEVAALLPDLVQQAPAMLPDDLGKEMVDAHAAMRAFTDQVSTLVEMAFADNYKANQELTPFLAASADLTQRMAALSNKLEAANEATAAGTADLKQALMMAMIGVIVIAIAGLIAFNL